MMIRDMNHPTPMRASGRMRGVEGITQSVKFHPLSLYYEDVPDNDEKGPKGFLPMHPVTPIGFDAIMSRVGGTE